MSFSVKQSSEDVTAWLCLDQLSTREQIAVCFREQKGAELQALLNNLCSRQYLWSPELLDFLGIVDAKVQKVCLNDYFAAKFGDQD